MYQMTSFERVPLSIDNLPVSTPLEPTTQKGQGKRERREHRALNALVYGLLLVAVVAIVLMFAREKQQLAARPLRGRASTGLQLAHS